MNLARARAAIGEQLYETLLREREHLRLTVFRLWGAESLPVAVIETLGPEIMDNGRKCFPTQWNFVKPAQLEEISGRA